MKSASPMSEFVRPRYRKSADGSIHDRLGTIHRVLKVQHLYWTIKKQVQEEILNPDSRVSNLQVDIPKFMESSGLAVKLRNAVCLLHSEAKLNSEIASDLPRPQLIPLDEPIDVVESARHQWDTRLRYELRAVAARQKRKLIQPRDFEQTNKGEEFLIRFVYTCEDLLEAIMAISNPNFSGTFTRVLGYGVIRLNLHTPTLKDLQLKYSVLAPDTRQIGMDDVEVGLEWFAEERRQTGEAITEDGSIPAIRQFAKSGVPVSLRPRIWNAILGVNVEAKEFYYYEALLTQIQHYDAITDDLTRFDVQDVADNDEYFVFEETLDEVMLAFSRDSMVPVLASLTTNTALLRSVAPVSFQGPEGQV
jgi:hypothetical protein